MARYQASDEVSMQCREVVVAWEVATRVAVAAMLVAAVAATVRFSLVCHMDACACEDDYTGQPRSKDSVTQH